MAIKVFFAGKNRIEPGWYSDIQSRIPDAPTAVSTGRVCIIDTGILTKDFDTTSHSYFGGLAGINGELASRKKAIYEFDNQTDFKKFVRGGVLWDLSQFLFNPQENTRGVQSIVFVSARTTTAGSLSYTVAGVSGGAKIKATVSGGAVTALTIINGGSGFSVAPTIAFSGGGGTGATATATITNGVITSVTITAPGTGYTTAPTVTVTGPTSGGTFTIKCKWEGLVGNGTLTGSSLTRGFGAVLVRGILDPYKYKIQFLSGSYKGMDKNGVPFDGGTAESATVTEILTETPEFTYLSEIKDYFDNDFVFNQYFKLSSFTTTGVGALDDIDFAANLSVNPIAGGTQSYGSTDLDDVLASLAEETFTFFLADHYGNITTGPNQCNALDNQNLKIVSHIQQQAKYNDKYMFVGGGKDRSQLQGSNSSVAFAKFYNTRNVIVVHGNMVTDKQTGAGNIREVDSIYTTALALGRIAGLASQEPGTQKQVRVRDMTHDLDLAEREIALQAGVLHFKKEGEDLWIINQSINTLQKNTQLINPDGSSYEISVERIKAELNQDLSINGSKAFPGKNRNTASPAEVKTWTEGRLQTRVATPQIDNLIISYKNVKVRTLPNSDSYFVEYEFIPNGPVNKIFSTGYMLDFNVQV